MVFRTHKGQVLMDLIMAVSILMSLVLTYQLMVQRTNKINKKYDKTGHWRQYGKN